MPNYQNKILDEYITVKDLMEILSISKTKAYEIATSGDLVTIRIGMCLRISVASLAKWIEHHVER